MVVTQRPADCCAPLVRVEPMPARQRDQLVGVMRALGEPTRLEIYRLVAGQTAPLCVCDIVERFPLRQPTISHHLKVLREAELLTVSRRGKWAYYAANPRGLEVLRQAATYLAPASLAAVS
jgi:ArsR family transcriptional regulator